MEHEFPAPAALGQHGVREQAKGGNRMSGDQCGGKKSSWETVPAPCQAPSLPIPFATPSPLSHCPPHITAPSHHVLSNTCSHYFGGYKVRARQGMPPSKLHGRDRGCLPTTYFHTGDFSHSLLNYECLRINGKFIATELKTSVIQIILWWWRTALSDTICSSGMLLHRIIKLPMPPEMPP